ncbi:MAG: DUF2156 domain-containing protein [Rhodobacteraceae bacterium]|nr:DUF2156 domain-containing protein [Paracoccaceae bacterium]
MASVLAFRAVYVALPALFAMAVLIRGPMRDAASSPPALLEAQEIARGPGLGPALFSAGRAECGILRQGQHGLLRAGATAAAVGRGRISLVALFDPLGPPGAVPGLLSVLAQEAAKEGRLPGLYKCGPHTAALARRAGWTVLRIAEEQVLDPRGAAGFAGPAYASLRRKLRRAEREGVTVEEAGAILPLPEMTAIARDWDMARGPERGFSMGRFDPDYVAGQRVFLARRDGRPIAFASFHEARAEWTLDLMRWSGGVPDGTMQSLVAGAVAAAAREGVPRLSLAALPCRRTAARIEAGLARLPLPPAIVTRLLGALGGAEGLRQFKVAFAPRPVPLYLAAPGRTALVLAALDIAAEIHRPRRLPGADPCRRGRRQCGQRRGSV